MEKMPVEKGFIEDKDFPAEPVYDSVIDEAPEGQEKKLRTVYEMVTKDKDGEAHRHALHVFDYPDKAIEGEDTRFLSQASPTIITSAEIAPRRSKEVITIPINDSHFGYRNENGILVPIPDPKKMDFTLQICQETQPNEIIINGDALDLAEDRKSVV